MTMPEQIETRMAADACWNEIEYGAKHRTRYEREREAFEEAEREGKKNE